MEGQEETLQQVQICCQPWWSGREGSWWVPKHEPCLSGQEEWAANPAQISPAGASATVHGQPMEMQLLHLLVVVISSKIVNIFILTGKNYSFFAVLHEDHHWKLIGSIFIWMVLSTWVQQSIIFLPKTLEKAGHLHHACPGKPGGCCPAGGQSPWSGSFYSEKEEFLLPGATSSSSCLSSKNYNSPWLCFPHFPLPWTLPTAQPCREAASYCLLPMPWIELQAVELSNVLFGGCTQWCFVCYSF